MYDVFSQRHKDNLWKQWPLGSILDKWGSNDGFQICHEEPFLNGFAHAGILRGANKILELTQCKLAELLRQYPSYQLVVTGHSLGAGTAIIVSMNILFRNVEHIEPERVRCIALAPPPGLSRPKTFHS